MNNPISSDANRQISVNLNYLRQECFLSNVQVWQNIATCETAEFIQGFRAQRHNIAPHFRIDDKSTDSSSYFIGNVIRAGRMS